MLTYEIEECPISDIAAIGHSAQQSSVVVIAFTREGLTAPFGTLFL